MFKKLRLKLFEKLYRMIEPNRDVGFVMIGNQIYVCPRDEFSVDNYLLKGTYNYDQVTELGALAGNKVWYGFCKEIGPVAFIGIANPEAEARSGYFPHDIREYGKPYTDDKYYFEAWTEEEAKHIGNYTVYGERDPRLLENRVPFEKIKYYYDYRYHIQDPGSDDFHRGVLKMQIELDGTYTYSEAKDYAKGKNDKDGSFTEREEAIKFALIDETKPVGIVGLYKEYPNASFREVWEYGEEQPKDQKIRFLTDEEAKEYDNYTLYYICPPYSRKYNARAVDHTLDRKFNFMMDNGIDYRLQDQDYNKQK